MKSQIDALLENDFKVLSRHPDTPYESLMTVNNNPLIMHYVRNIYQEYQLKDPLPKRYSTKGSQNNSQARTKKIKLALRDEF